MRGEIMQICDIFRLRVVDYSRRSLILEATREKNKLDASKTRCGLWDSRNGADRAGIHGPGKDKRTMPQIGELSLSD